MTAKGVMNWPTRLEKLYLGLVLFIFAGVTVYTPLSIYLGSIWPDYYLLFRASMEILLGLTAVVMVVCVTQRQLWRQLWRDWLLRLIAGFAGLHLLMTALLYQGLQPTLAGILIDLRFLLFFVLVYVLIRLIPTARRAVLGVTIASAAVVVAFGALQLFLPADILSHIGYSDSTIRPYTTVDKNPDYIRINSTLRGPNPLGAYAIIVLAMTAAAMTAGRSWLADRRHWLLMSGLAAGGAVMLWVSYSRSAALGALAALAIISLIVYGRRLPIWGWLATAAVVAGLLAAGFLLRESDFVANVILHDDPETGAVETSNDGHLNSLIHGSQLMLKQPLGAGVGSTGSASIYSEGSSTIIENQYLFIAHEVGWLGLVLFLVISGLVLWRLWLRRSQWLAMAVFASGVGLAMVGILLPVWVDITVAIVWWGLAAAVLAEPGD